MLTLGNNIKDGSPVQLTLDERRQGTYIIGTTGTGKSTLLRHMIYQDMCSDLKHGLCVLDPHGDLIDDLLGLVPQRRLDDVILFNPMDFDRPFGLNLLECERYDPRQVQWVVSTVMTTLHRLFSWSWGPQLEDVLRSTILTAMEIDDSTFLELFLLLTNPDFAEKIIEKVKDPVIRRFWTDFPKPKNWKERMELTGSTLNKITPFISDRQIRNIIGQPHNTLNMRKIMDEGKILFVNLSKGDLGEINSGLLGSVLVNLILIAALQRRKDAYADRRPFHLYVDEFQNFTSTESFAILQSEARKYAVDLVVAHQYRDQLDLLNKGSTLNVGNMIIFRVNGRDSYELASQFDNTPPPPEMRMEPLYERYDYQGLDLWIQKRSRADNTLIYEEIELPARPYNDVEAEMANRLSILPNYEAWCRLIHDPKSRYEDKDGNQTVPRLVEYHFKTEFHEDWKDQTDEERRTKDEKKQISDYIRARSSAKAPTREKVEKDIEKRTLGYVNAEDEYPAAEPLL